MRKGRELKDLTNQRFGRLIVINRQPNRISPSGLRRTMWSCLCDCGTTKDIYSWNLVRGLVVSCGCRMRAVGKEQRTHGRSKTKEYRAWRTMINRCTKPASTSYPDYGGRGVKVCERWGKFSNFLADMGERPPGLTIERNDNDGDYLPDNCRWATMREQSNNRRNTVRLSLNGVTRPLTYWADILGISASLIHARLKLGWTVEDALIRPKRQQQRRV